MVGRTQVYGKFSTLAETQRSRHFTLTFGSSGTCTILNILYSIHFEPRLRGHIPGQGSRILPKELDFPWVGSHQNTPSPTPGSEFSSWFLLSDSMHVSRLRDDTRDGVGSDLSNGQTGTPPSHRQSDLPSIIVVPSQGSPRQIITHASPFIKTMRYGVKGGCLVPIIRVN